MNSIKKNTLIVTIIILLINIISLLRDMLLANRFGVGITNDIFIASQSIIMVFASFLMQSYISAYLPYAADYYYGNSEKRKGYFAAIYVHVFLLGLIQIFICWFAMYGIINLVTPGFSKDAKEILGLALMIQSPILITQMINGVSDTNLQVIGKYSLVQISTAVPYLSSVLYLIFSPNCSLNGLIISITIGNFIMLLMKIPTIEHYIKPRIARQIWYPSMKSMYAVAGLAMITTAVRQVNTLVGQAVSSLLGEGSLTLLSYAMKIPATLASLVSLALSMIIFSEMAKNISNQQKDKNEKLLTESIALITTLVLPFSMYTVVYRKEIIMLLFERGAFTANDTAEVAKLMIFYAASMFAIALQDIIVRAMFAYKVRRYSVVTSIILVFVNTILNLTLYKIFGNVGIAVSYSFSVIIIIPILLFYCNKSVIKIDWKKFVLVILQATSASILAGGVAWFLNKLFIAVGLYYLVSAIISGIISIIVYVIIGLITRNSIVISLYNLIMDRIRRIKIR